MTGRLFLAHAAVTFSLLPGIVGVGQAFAQDQNVQNQTVQNAPAQNPVATFRSSVDVVSVSAVVRDRKGRFVSNLGRTDFVVTEAGRSRPILDFRAPAAGPVT